jgi:hypothetical protein
VRRRPTARVSAAEKSPAGASALAESSKSKASARCWTHPSKAEKIPPRSGSESKKLRDFVCTSNYPSSGISIRGTKLGWLALSGQAGYLGSSF